MTSSSPSPKLDLTEDQWALLPLTEHARKTGADLAGLAPVVLDWMQWQPELNRSERINKIGYALYEKRLLDRTLIGFMRKSFSKPDMDVGRVCQQFKDWVGLSLDKVGAYLLSKEETRDATLDAILLQNNRNIRLREMDKLPFQSSLLRRQDGSLRNPAELSKLLNNSANVNAVVFTVSRTSDFEAFEALKSRPIKRHLETEAVVAHAKSNHHDLSEAFMSYLVGGQGVGPDAAKSEMKLIDWLGAAIGAVPNGAWKVLQPVYRQDFAALAGHEVIQAMFRRETPSKPGDDHLVRQLIADGADWYIGFKQYLMGGHVYLAFKDREKAPLMELQELVESGARKGVAPVTKLILEALPVDLVLACAADKSKADRMFKISKLPYLRDHVSEKLLAANLEDDLNL